MKTTDVVERVRGGMNELKALTARLIEALANNPSALRQPLTEVLPDVIRGIRDLGQDKTVKPNIRHACFDQLLALQARIIREDLRRAEAACRRREADVAAIEARVELVKARTEAMAETRKRRALDAKYARFVKKIGEDNGSQQTQS